MFQENFTKILAIILSMICAAYGQNEFLSCTYQIDETYGYTCVLSIRNLNGVNNFTEILGTHLGNYSDIDVTRVFSHANRSITTNIPSIICRTFYKTKFLFLRELGIEVVGINALSGCENLVELQIINNFINDLPEGIFKGFSALKLLNLGSNRINQLRPQWFASMRNLQDLRLGSNNIRELPPNVFVPLRSVERIELQNNLIRAIHSDSFGVLIKFSTLTIQNNSVQAIDERFIDNTDITNINILSNICVNLNFVDATAARTTMRTNLRPCLNNYLNLINGE